MNFPLPFAASLLTLPVSVMHLSAQESGSSKWDVEIPTPPVVETPAEPRQKPAPIQFNVLESRTTRRDVKEASPMPGLPPAAGNIAVTVQLVKNPGLPDPPPTLPALPPDDPAVLGRLKELRNQYRGTDLVFISATVFDESKTLLRIYPNGQTDKEVIAWSNVNFLHFCGNGFYRVHHDDGTYQDFGILLGISNSNTEQMQRWASRSGKTDQAPEIPELPDLASEGSAFVIVEGDDDSPAMDTLEQTHDLYTHSGKVMEETYLAREKANAERKSDLLANPPTPDDVVIQFWKR